MGSNAGQQLGPAGMALLGGLGRRKPTGPTTPGEAQAAGQRAPTTTGAASAPAYSTTPFLGAPGTGIDRGPALPPPMVVAPPQPRNTLARWMMGTPMGRGGSSPGYSTSGRGGSFGGTGSSARSGGLY